MADAPAAVGMLQRKVAGVPVWVIGAGVLVLAFYLMHKNSSSSGTGTGNTTGAGFSGTATVYPQRTNVTVNETGGATSTNTQASTTDVHNTPVPPKTSTTSVSYSTYTVKAGQSLADIAKMFNISVAQLAHSNVYVSGELPGNAKTGQTLGTGAGLKTGQKLEIPHYTTTG